MKSVTLVNLVPQSKDTISVPLGPLYIAAVMEREGCSVDFRDYQLSGYENPLKEENMHAFLSHSEDNLAISCLFNVIPFLLPVLRKIKEESPEKRIILGGPGPTVMAEKLMEKFPFVDVVVKGEGEKTAAELARDLPYKDVKGIVYRDDGRVICTPERERIHHLDDLPLPAYEKIDLSTYTQMSVITARGCPYRCTFCEVAPIWGYHTEQRSVSGCVAEMKFLYERGVRDFHINDDTFVLNRKWVLSFCSTLKEEGLDFSWKCLGRVNLMDEDLLSAMGGAGCTGVQYGIESGSEQVLERVGKQITVPQIRKVIRMSVDHLECVISTFIWGFPFETMGDFFQTIYLMGEAAQMGSVVKLLFLSPAPLSPLYREYKDQLQFDEKFVSHLLWGNYGDKISVEEKEKVVEMIRQNPDLFSAFHYIYTPDVEKKYQYLQKAGMVQE